MINIYLTQIYIYITFSNTPMHKAYSYVVERTESDNTLRTCLVIAAFLFQTIFINYTFSNKKQMLRKVSLVHNDFTSGIFLQKKIG